MARLRKMLGDIQHPTTVALMRLIETQSKATLARWATKHAAEAYLPIYEAHAAAASPALSDAIHACLAHLDGALRLPELKPLLKQARATAAAEADPVAQAAARAVAAGCATILTPTNALGHLFYGAAAIAYDRIGLAAAPNAYDDLANQELARALQSLQAAAIADEPHPAKIDWGC